MMFQIIPTWQLNADKQHDQSTQQVKIYTWKQYLHKKIKNCRLNFRTINLLTFYKNLSLKFSYKNGLNITSIETHLILAVAGLIHAKVQPDWFMHAFINVRQMGTEVQEEETNK